MDEKLTWKCVFNTEAGFQYFGDINNAKAVVSKAGYEFFVFNKTLYYLTTAGKILETNLTEGDVDEGSIRLINIYQSILKNLS